MNACRRTRTLTDLNGGLITLKANHLTDEVVVTDAHELVHRRTGHLLGDDHCNVWQAVLEVNTMTGQVTRIEKNEEVSLKIGKAGMGEEGGCPWPGAGSCTTNGILATICVTGQTPDQGTTIGWNTWANNVGVGMGVREKP